jgi:hypothetical protein
MEQTTELMKTMQEEIGANQKEIKQDIKMNQAKADAKLKEIRAAQELLKEEMLEKLDANTKG